LPEIKRGIVKGYTDSSRFRSLQYIAGIDWKSAGECYFATLSYPDTSQWEDYEIRQRHLTQFARDLKTHYDRPIGFVWRIEWLTRKSGERIGMMAPHVHMLLFNCPNLTNRNLNLWWQRSLQWDQYVNTLVEYLRDREIVGIYICKYGAKQDSLLGYDAYLSSVISGRAWGHRYASHIPRHPVVEKRLALNGKIEACMHAARGFAACEMMGYNESFTVLGPDAVELIDFMSRYTVDGEIPDV